MTDKKIKARENRVDIYLCFVYYVFLRELVIYFADN
jgi:hypothetical protein